MRGDVDAEGNVLYAMDASNHNFPAAQAGDCAQAAQARRIRSDFRSAGGQDECVGPASCGNRACAELRGGGDYADRPTAGLNRDDAAVVLGLLRRRPKRGEDRKRAIIVVTDNPEVADQMEHCAELE